MADIKEIAWIAGLLEGEGCFFIRNRGHSPTIQLIMTDMDIVIRAAEIMGAHRVIRCAKDTKAGKPLYRMNVYGRRCAEWMMTLYSLLSQRRKEQVAKALSAWKQVRVYSDRKIHSEFTSAVWVREGRV